MNFIRRFSGTDKAFFFIYLSIYLSIYSVSFSIFPSPVELEFSIRRLHLCKWVRPLSPTNERPGYDTKLIETPFLELLETWSTPLLPLLLGL